MMVGWRVFRAIQKVCDPESPMYGKTIKSLTKEKVLSSGLYLGERWGIVNTSARTRASLLSDSCQEQRGEALPCTALDKTPINTKITTRTSIKEDQDGRLRLLLRKNLCVPRRRCVKPTSDRPQDV